GTGIIYHFEGWLRPHLDSGALEPVLEPWWQRFTGPFLYYLGRRLVPAPLRAFVDFIRATGSNRQIRPPRLRTSYRIGSNCVLEGVHFRPAECPLWANWRHGLDQDLSILKVNGTRITPVKRFKLLGAPAQSA